jgi:hypothetical protein
MKRLATTFAALMAATIISALPVLAAEGGMGYDSDQQPQKDECLLVSQNCRDSVDNIQQRIDRLHREINKGTSVYTPAELRQLEFQLRETNEMLMQLMQSGGA